MTNGSIRRFVILTVVVVAGLIATLWVLRSREPVVGSSDSSRLRMGWAIVPRDILRDRDLEGTFRSVETGDLAFLGKRLPVVSKAPWSSAPIDKTFQELTGKRLLIIQNGVLEPYFGSRTGAECLRDGQGWSDGETVQEFIGGVVDAEYISPAGLGWTSEPEGGEAMDMLATAIISRDYIVIMNFPSRFAPR